MEDNTGLKDKLDIDESFIKKHYTIFSKIFNYVDKKILSFVLLITVFSFIMVFLEMITPKDLFYHEYTSFLNLIFLFGIIVIRMFVSFHTVSELMLKEKKRASCLYIKQRGTGHEQYAATVIANKERRK